MIFIRWRWSVTILLSYNLRLAMVLAQLYYTFIEVEHSYVNKHHYRWNAANESSAIQLYT